MKVAQEVAISHTSMYRRLSIVSLGLDVHFGSHSMKAFSYFLYQRKLFPKEGAPLKQIRTNESSPGACDGHTRSWKLP